MKQHDLSFPILHTGKLIGSTDIFTGINITEGAWEDSVWWLNMMLTDIMLLVVVLHSGFSVPELKLPIGLVT